ncbi:hypothetical protein ACVIW0_001730 [Bradyrhizobium sp. USDA 4454]
MSSRRRPGGGFTLEMQHLSSKGLRWGPEVKAFARGVVVCGDELAEASGWELVEIGFARDEAAHATDGVLDATFLPGGVRIAEEGLHQEALQGKVRCELGTVVEGDGLAHLLWQRLEQTHEIACDTGSELAWEADAEQQAGGALVHGQDLLTVFGEHHQIGLPMAGSVAIGDLDGPFIQGNTAFDEACGTSAPLATAAALALGAWQIVPPAAVRGASDLGIDEAVDALVGDHLASMLDGQPAGDLFGRPATAKAIQHRAAQDGLPFEASARPAPRSHPLLGIVGLVAGLNAMITVHLPRDR